VPGPGLQNQGTNSLPSANLSDSTVPNNAAIGADVLAFRLALWPCSVPTWLRSLSAGRAPDANSRGISAMVASVRDKR